jgi:hypothetical protein
MGTNAKASDEEIEAQIRSGKTQSQILETLKIKHGGGTVLRIRAISKRIGVPISRHPTSRRTAAELSAADRITEHLKGEGRQYVEIQNGVALVGSDAHYYPNIISTAHRAFVHFCKELKPAVVVKNGDEFDGSTISRHPRIGWDEKPTILQELKAVEVRQQEIVDACRTKRLFWNLGNHDARYETFLAANAPQFQGVDGFHLKDHFPEWKPCWSVWINEDVVIKHRWKGGAHATHNNTLASGKTMVTGHLHSLKVTPYTDYNGTRFGVDTGTLAQPHGPQFNDYTEDGPVNWRSGFAVLTFWKGNLLWPEVVHVIDEEKGLVQFRGEVIRV